MTVNAEQFNDAWTELRDRMANAIAMLTGMKIASPDDVRVAGKFDGLDQATGIFQRLDAQAYLTGDYAGAWRQFTDDVFAAYLELADRDLARPGLALALEYQRGYGDGIDAPPLVALHARTAR